MIDDIINIDRIINDIGWLIYSEELNNNVRVSLSNLKNKLRYNFNKLKKKIKEIELEINNLKNSNLNNNNLNNNNVLNLLTLDKLKENSKNIIYNIEQNNTAKVLELLNYDFDVNYIDNFTGNNILMHAIKYNLINIANILINMNFNIHHKNKSGNTALSLFINLFKFKDYFNPINEDDFDKYNEYNKLCMLLINLGSDVNHLSVNEDKNNLFTLLDKGLYNLVEMIYDSKRYKNITSRNKDGDTILSISLFKKYDSLSEKLIKSNNFNLNENYNTLKQNYDTFYNENNNTLFDILLSVNSINCDDNFNINYKK